MRVVKGISLLIEEKTFLVNQLLGPLISLVKICVMVPDPDWKSGFNWVCESGFRMWIWSCQKPGSGAAQWAPMDPKFLSESCQFWRVPGTQLFFFSGGGGLFFPGFYKEMPSTLADQERPRIWVKMRRDGGSCRVPANQWVQLYTGAQIKFADLTPYLTYGFSPS